MQVIDSPDANVYSYILTEAEWYIATQQEREAWTVQIQREAQALGRKYTNILVDPDAVMSMSPKPHRHVVWKHSFDAVTPSTQFTAEMAWHELLSKERHDVGETDMMLITLDELRTYMARAR